ncbi:MAG: rhodanese-like domain-containing protein, partial [Myxococcales bacterium]|nr:rhodanese-like domain-containing protein [Myxococcales bacterium]
MDLQTFQAATQRTSGMAEVSAPWAAAHRAEVKFIDVRQPHELTGPLGAAEGVQNIPLDDLLTQVGQWDRETPTVLICRSGRRSGIATAAFEAKGYRNVASVEGGTLAWNTEVLGLGDIHLSERKTSAATLREATYTTNGLPEVSPDWVHGHLGLVRFVDVREPDE